MITKKRVLITGATGFVGANLAFRLFEEGHELHLLVRPGYQDWRIKELLHQVTVHEISLLDPDSLTRLIGQIKPDWVFHLAVHGAYSWQTSVQEIMQTNFMGTINLVEACLQHPVEAFINTGSSSEYGFKDHPPSESEYLEPNSYYSVAKGSASLYCSYIASLNAFPITTLRLYSVYGPFEEAKRLIPTLILYGLSNQLPSLTNPDVVRDYVYIDDVLDAYLLAAQSSVLAPVYNVGTGLQTSLKEVVSIAREALKIAIEPSWGSMDGRSWDTSVWVADSGQLQKTLGWKPSVDFKNGFEKTINWFRQNSSQFEPYQSFQKAKLLNQYAMSG